jgi:hypothetical protein
MGSARRVRRHELDPLVWNELSQGLSVCLGANRQSPRPFLRRSQGMIDTDPQDGVVTHRSD